MIMVVFGAINYSIHSKLLMGEKLFFFLANKEKSKSLMRTLKRNVNKAKVLHFEEKCIANEEDLDVEAEKFIFGERWFERQS